MNGNKNSNPAKVEGATLSLGASSKALQARRTSLDLLGEVGFKVQDLRFRVQRLLFRIWSHLIRVDYTCLYLYLFICVYIYVYTVILHILTL